LGVYVVVFNECSALKQARESIVRAGRLNFRLPVLTRFRWAQQGRSLALVFSETPLQAAVAATFDAWASINDPLVCQ
jgi:hypothetical protein